MKINLDYKFKYTEEEKKRIDEVTSEQTQMYITQAVASSYKDGLEGQKRRIWGRIQRKLDTAIDDKTYNIELEEAEKDFIEEVFKSGRFPAVWSQNVNTLEDELINKLKDEK